jgi:hypothetical protein
MSNVTTNSNPATSRESPNDILALQISEVLVAAGLITDTHKTALLAKLKAGGVRQEDWNLWIDVATARQIAQENDK